MTRVLHLLTASAARGGADAALPALVADTIQHEPGEHHALLLGGETLRDAAHRAGLKPYTLLPDSVGRLPVPMPNHPKLKALFAACDRVDCWTDRAATIARRLGAPAVQPRFQPDNLIRVAQQVSRLDRLETCDRAAVRKCWGLEDHDCAVAFIGEAAIDGDTRTAALTAVMVAGILDQRADAAGRLAILCHPAQYERPAAQTMLDGADRGRLLIQAPELATPWATLPACDAVLTTIDTQPPTLNQFWAENAGLRVLTCATGQARELARAVLGHIDGDTTASNRESDRMIQTA